MKELEISGESFEKPPVKFVVKFLEELLIDIVKLFLKTHVATPRIITRVILVGLALKKTESVTEKRNECFSRNSYMIALKKFYMKK